VVCILFFSLLDTLKPFLIIIVLYTISGIKAILQDSSVKIADDEDVSPSSSIITRVSCYITGAYALAHVLCTKFYLRPPRIKKKKVNLIYFRQFHYTTQWNNNLLIPLSGVMKLT
jgi:hypothetical protein